MDNSCTLRAAPRPGRPELGTSSRSKEAPQIAANLAGLAASMPGSATNKSPAESDRRLTDTAIGMPQWQSTQLQFAKCTPCSYATVQWRAKGMIPWDPWGHYHLCLSLSHSKTLKFLWLF